MSKHTVAVYGSLRQGLGNHRLLAHVPEFKEGKTVQPFIMYSMGGFPAIVDGGDSGVVVEVYEVDDDTLQRLNQLEGYSGEYGYQGFYDRKVVDVELDSGDEVQAHIYYFHEAPNNSVVDTGDWKEYTSKYVY